MENIIISNPEHLKEIKNKILKQGKEKFHVLADFDKTLTYAHKKDGKEYPSLISVLRNENYISEDYSKKAKELAEKYRRIEYDPKVPHKKKKKYMNEWWTLHNKLLIKSGLNKKNIELVVDSGIIKLRDGAGEFLDYLDEKKIPLLILSSSGIGNAIQIFLEKQGKFYNNIQIITNIWKFDQKGKVIGLEGSVIHAMNKDETMVHDFPEIYKRIKDRKNVLLMGDSIGDLGMIEGFDYDNLLKVGFLNDNVKENIKNYKKNFDVVITSDSDMKYIINNILQF